jgi:hypothetical protein
MLPLADFERFGRRNTVEGGADAALRCGSVKVREQRHPYRRTATGAPIGRHFQCGGGWLPFRDLFPALLAAREFYLDDRPVHFQRAPE